MSSDKIKTILKWTLPVCIVSFAGIFFIDSLAGELHRSARRPGEHELIDYYAPQFKIITAVILGLLTLILQYLVCKISKYFVRRLKSRK